MDAFRSIPMNIMAMNTEPRITTSNTFYTKKKAERMATLRGLNKLFYNMSIDSRCVEANEVNMLCSMRSEHWSRNLNMFYEPSLAEKASKKTDKAKKELLGGFITDHAITVATLKKLADLSKLYKQQIVSGAVVSDQSFEIKRQYIGKIDAKE